MAQPLPVADCEGPYKGGRKLLPKDISKVGVAHICGADLEGSDLTRVNLEKADLRSAILKGADLSGTNLTDAILRKADLRGANLSRANLSSAILWDADLRGATFIFGKLDKAEFSRANLRGAILSDTSLVDSDLKDSILDTAHLSGADMKRANLMNANLSNAVLENADLENANLENAHFEGADMRLTNLTNANLAGAYLDDAVLMRTPLAGANLTGAHVTGANFDLLPSSLPDPLELSSAEGLQFVEFSETPAGLVKLRSEFRDLGLRYQENQLTCAIRRSELRRTSARVGPPNNLAQSLIHPYLIILRQGGVPLHGSMERCANYLLFDFPCQYGASPARALAILATLFFFFSVIYVSGQKYPEKLGGIWVVWENDRLDKTAVSKSSHLLTGGFPPTGQRGQFRRTVSIVMLAAYFSLLSTLRIGWSGLNFGTWLSRMQLREYSLRATGWIRFVSGLQSLISVYLVALAILTYFGTPFEY
jgi:uncharacterized protein YjbI with pentapeptide repeats